MNKDTYEMIIELILYYWIGLQPSNKADTHISNFIEGTGLSPETLVDEARLIRKENK